MTTENDKTKIRCLTDFLEWINNFQRENLNKEYFFRGHSKLCFTLAPSVYRENNGKSFRSAERNMYLDMLNLSPNEFDERDVFGNLVKMQHLGLPTRLLDVTRNALVALYFCCKENSCHSGGRVYSFAADKIKVIHPQTLSQAELFFINDHMINDPEHADPTDSLCQLTNPWDALMGDMISEVKNSLENFNFTIHKRNKSIYKLKWILDRAAEPDHMITEQFLTDFVIDAQINDALTKNRGMFLFHDVVEKLGVTYGFDCQGMSLDEFYKRITTPKLIFSPLNNARISAQQGAFILFPAHPDAVEYFKDTANDKELFVESAIVLESKKSVILEELKLFGIHEHILFPDSEKVADFVKEKYKFQSNWEAN